MGQAMAPDERKRTMKKLWLPLAAAALTAAALAAVSVAQDGGSNESRDGGDALRGGPQLRLRTALRRRTGQAPRAETFARSCMEDQGVDASAAPAPARRGRAEVRDFADAAPSQRAIGVSLRRVATSRAAAGPPRSAYPSWGPPLSRRPRARPAPNRHHQCSAGAEQLGGFADSPTGRVRAVVTDQDRRGGVHPSGRLAVRNFKTRCRDIAYAVSRLGRVCVPGRPCGL